MISIINKIFQYENETFALDIIYNNFKNIYQNSFFVIQNKFLDDLKINKDDFNNFLNSIEQINEYNILKSIRTEKYELSKEFEEYYISKLYYTLAQDTFKYSKNLSSIILSFHLQYLNYNNKNNESFNAYFRLFSHLIEIFFTLEQNKDKLDNLIKIIQTDNLEELIDAILNNKITSIKLQDEDTGYFKIKINNYILDIQSNIIIKTKEYLKEARKQLTSFKVFYNDNIKRSKNLSKSNEDKDTTKYNKELLSDNIDIDVEVIITKVKHTVELPVDENIEKNLRQKENLKVKITGNIKNTKYQQYKNMSAISASIAKNKLKLPSLYTVPSISELSTFCKYLLEKDDEIEYYALFFITTILTGLIPARMNKILNKRITNIIKVKHNMKLYAKFEGHDNRICYNSDIDAVEYEIPLILKYCLLKLKNSDVTFNEDELKDYIKMSIKKYDKVFYINWNKIWDTFLIHQSIFDKSSNTESLLATQNIDQNNTPLIAYTSVNNNLEKHSRYIEKYIEVLDLTLLLNDKIKKDNEDPKDTVRTEKKLHLYGSKKIVNSDAFVSFLNNIYTVFKRCKNLKQFNLYSIYVRYSFSILIGTRNFEKSIDITKVSIKNSVILIQEKEEYENSGYRIVPLSKLALEIIINYKKILKKLNYEDNKIIVISKTNQQLPATLSNIKKISVEYNFDKYNLFNLLDKIPLNFGRHVLVTLATESGIKQDYIKAFMGHCINGDEHLGLISMNDTTNYLKEFRAVLEEVSDIYQIKDLSNEYRF